MFSETKIPLFPTLQQDCDNRCNFPVLGLQDVYNFLGGKTPKT